MSYLRNYLRYSANNEAPEMMHVFAAYTALSAAIGRRVWLPHGEYAIYANIYVMFVGNAGAGKSYAMKPCQKLLAQLKNVEMSSSVETPEGLIRIIAGNPNANPPIVSGCCVPRRWPDGQIRDVHEMLILANEFIDFIRTNPETWTGFLNNIYDQDFYTYRTKGATNGSNSDTIPGPYIVLLGCIPTDVASKLQDFDIINTGLARRTFFIHGERRYANPVPVPTFTADEKAARDLCLGRLKQIQEMSGAFIQTPEAVEWWDSWYRKQSKLIPTKSTPATLGWLSSKSVQVMKLAMLNSLSERDDLLITPAEFELGLSYIEIMEQSFGMIFGAIGRNELAGLTMRIMEHFKLTNEPEGFKSLSNKFYSSFSAGKGFAELHEILKYLQDTGQLVAKTLTIGPVSELIYATPPAMIKFEAELSAKRDLPPSITQTGSQMAVEGAAGPSPELSLDPKSLGAHQASAQSASETDSESPPTVP